MNMCKRTYIARAAPMSPHTSLDDIRKKRRNLRPTPVRSSPPTEPAAPGVSAPTTASPTARPAANAPSTSAAPPNWPNRSAISSPSSSIPTSTNANSDAKPGERKPLSLPSNANGSKQLATSDSTPAAGTSVDGAPEAIPASAPKPPEEHLSRVAAMVFPQITSHHQRSLRKIVGVACNRRCAVRPSLPQYLWPHQT